MPSQPKASLIVCTYNREALLVQTLECALEQDYPDLEILVIDQTRQHEDTTAQFLANASGRLHLHFSEVASLTRARNLGLQLADGDVLIFVDDDTTFEPGFVSEHVKAHLAGHGAVQGKVAEDGNILHPDARPQWMTWYLKVKGTNNCLTAGPTNTLTGCNFSLSRQAVQKVGPFDEQFTGIAIREDADYGLRCHRAGIKMIFWPGAALFHHRSGSGGVGTRENVPFFQRSYYYNEMLFARKHFPLTIRVYYRVRLFLRGIRAVRKVIGDARREIQELPGTSD